MSKRISLLNRNFEDYKNSLIELSKTYYPDLADKFDDASVASWLIDLVAAVGDNESYHIDRAYQETNIDDAQERSSLLAIARNNGVKVPGPKGSMAEIEISCIVSTNNDVPNDDELPIVKKGSVFASATQKFELLYDVDFGCQYNYYNESDRTIEPLSSNQYRVTKLAVVVAGETLVESFSIGKGDQRPFMELVIPRTDVMNIESVIEVECASNNIVNPSYDEFYSCSGNGLTRYYEVNSFAQNEIWDDCYDNENKPVIYENPVGGYKVTKGEWKPVDHKFITEYTDNGNLRIVFGAGNGSNINFSGNNIAEFSKWQISRILNNNNLGVLPKEGNMIYVLYRAGGGSASNVAAGAINKVLKLNLVWKPGNLNIDKTNIESHIKVKNNYPSVSGKDAPSESELRYLIKYHNAAQERCVTVKDYIDRLLQLPPKYGTPFRIGAEEMNNKIMISLIGIDHNGKLSSDIPLAIAKNIEEYLSHYRMINDYVEIKSGRIVNLAFDLDVYYNKAYHESEIDNTIKNKITQFMDIKNHVMGDNLYISDLEKEIWGISGVKNIASLKVTNKAGGTYSDCEIGQPCKGELNNAGVKEKTIDLDYSMRTVYCDNDTMFELKYPENDITVKLHAI